MTALLEKLLPVLMMIALGWLLRKMKIISAETVGEIKNLIIQIALPFMLFLTFSKAVLEAKYILIVVLMFLLCLTMYGLGFFLRRISPKTFGSLFTPWFLSGFEFGMIGIGLFSALFGTENLPLITLIGLGHEFFAWFIAIPYVQFQSSGSFSLSKTLGKFVRTPVILGIMGGLAANLSGAYPFLESVFWGKALLSAMLTVSNILVPMILMVIGYSLVMEKNSIGKILKHLAARLIPILGVGTLVLLLIRKLVAPTDPLFTIAFYAFLILPPSYLVPVLVKDNEEERRFFSQAVIYYTLISFLGYIVLLLA